MEKLYFDYASTTPVDEDVLKAYIDASKDFVNPSALNTSSLDVKRKIEECREHILRVLNGKPKSKFVFTSCASESNNTVLRSCIRRKDKKYIVTIGEHSSIYNTCKAMINEGYNIDFVPLKADGTVDEDVLYSMIDNKTDFLSIIHVNNETGAINDIKSIVKNVKKINPNILVHSDGVQALKKLDVNLTDLGVDFYTISSHKINGVKGVAGLYISSNARLIPLIYGGGQEMGLRGGTENYSAVKAFEVAISKPNFDLKILQNVKDEFINHLSVPYHLISKNNCVPNIISIAFDGVRGETLLHLLDDKGFIVGTGSACNSKDTTNRVLYAMGITKKLALGNLRISFDYTSKENLISLADAINDGVNYLRRLNN